MVKDMISVDAQSLVADTHTYAHLYAHTQSYAHLYAVTHTYAQL